MPGQWPSRGGGAFVVLGSGAAVFLNVSRRGGGYVLRQESLLTCGLSD